MKFKGLCLLCIMIVFTTGCFDGDSSGKVSYDNTSWKSTSGSLLTIYEDSCSYVSADGKKGGCRYEKNANNSGMDHLFVYVNMSCSEGMDLSPDYTITNNDYIFICGDKYYYQK